MEFVKSDGTEKLHEALKGALTAALSSDKAVLWLVPGGSNIKVATKVMAELPSGKLENLTIMLTDERYGEPGHADSNFQQYKAEGFDSKSAVFKDILSGKSLEETVDSYAAQAKDYFEKADVVIAFLGMGPDNHIAGILPHSPATTTDEKWVVGYDGGQFQRMTLTPYALSHANMAFVGAFGDEKKPALEKLCKTADSIADQPSRILCHLPHATIFNDQIGDEV